MASTWPRTRSDRAAAVSCSNRDGFRDVRRLRAIERRDVGARQRGERGVVGAQHRRRQVVDAGCLLARHHLVAALADLREPLLEVLGTRLLLVARDLLGDHRGPFLGGAEGEQDMAGAGVEEANARANADGHAPVAGRVHLGDHRDVGAVVDRQMVRLHCAAARALISGVAWETSRLMGWWKCARPNSLRVSS